MTITMYDIKEFERRIDPDVSIAGYSHKVAIILFNRNIPKTYYLHNIDEFWHNFGREYPKFGGWGISVEKKVLEDAIQKPNAWTVIMMRNTKVVPNTLTFYGLPSREWYNFCNSNEQYPDGMWNNHSRMQGATNGSIPAKMVVNLEKLK